MDFSSGWLGDIPSWITTVAVLMVGKSNEWGVRILNTSGSTFHDVEIETVVDNRPVSESIRLRVVPPGDLFAKLLPAKPKWALPVDSGECAGPLRPLTRTAEWSMTRVRFSDDRNQRWMADDRGVLSAEKEREISSTSV